MTNTHNNNDDELNQLNNLDDPNFLKQEYRNTITSEETPEDSQSEFHELVEYIDEEIEETDEDESSAIFNEEVIEDIVSVNTSSVKNIIINIDKISQIAFNSDKKPDLYQGTLTRIAMERRGTKKKLMPSFP